MTLVCKSAGIWDGIVNPISGFERSWPRDSKTVSYVDVGLL